MARSNRLVADDVLFRSPPDSRCAFLTNWRSNHHRALSNGRRRSVPFEIRIDVRELGLAILADSDGYQMERGSPSGAGPVRGEWRLCPQFVPGVDTEETLCPWPGLCRSVTGPSTSRPTVPASLSPHYRNIQLDGCWQVPGIFPARRRDGDLLRRERSLPAASRLRGGLGSLFRSLFLGSLHGRARSQRHDCPAAPARWPAG
jgi:hypothetical protein